MAEIPRKDRAAIKSDIALSRDRMARELSGLRYELDIPRKIKNSFRDQTAIWIGALAVVGLLIAIAGAKEKSLRSRERQFQGKRQRFVGGRSAGWRHEICRNFAAAGISEVCDQ